MLLTDLTNNKKIEVGSGLHIVSTPIGNRYDITIRAILILSNSNVIVCEDTRVTKKLLNILKISIRNKKWISYNDYNASFKIKSILEEIASGQVVSLVSDAGTPLLSDPGYKLVKEVLKRKLKITPVPGVSAITTSLIASGAKTDKFCFLGFLPKNKNKFINVLREYSSLKATLIIFEKSNRLKFLIETVKEHFNNSDIIITKELTKIHEEVIFVDSTNIEKYIKEDFNLKGELTIILDLNNSKKEKVFSNNELVEYLKTLKPSNVASMLAKSSSQKREEIYRRCIKLLKE
tara:strand:- start:973 stop:1845 length:873 start_codon:yes stop_codon:yes gene_type:complete